MPQPSDSAVPAGAAVKLPAYCNTAAAADLHPVLVEACSGDTPVAIDASEVESLGQAVIQLLVAAAADADSHRGPPVAVIHPSAAFAQRIAACGLDGRTPFTNQEESVQ